MRVLGVDDEEDMLLLCRLALERSGHEFVGVTNGVDALAVLATDQVDIVLLDMMMPVLDGIGTLVEMRARREDQPAVVMLSARAEPGDQIRALEAGAVDYLTKPFSPLVLPDFLSNIVRMGKAERDAHRGRLLAHLGADAS